MQITPSNSDQKPVVTSAAVSGHQATISNNTQFLIQVLTNLYRDPLGAPIREALTNAADIHLAMEKADTPIEVWVPSAENPLLRIRDHGCGLPEKLIYEHYLVYGDSSKREDTTQVGGFGLGCKAPLAYADQFHVISVFNGLRSHYVISTSPDSVPLCTKLYDVPHTDPDWQSGLEVGIPIKAADVRSAINLVIGQASWLLAPVQYHDLPDDYADYVHTAKWTYEEQYPELNWYLSPDDSQAVALSKQLSPWQNLQPLLVEMGGVAYPIDGGALRSALGSRYTPLYAQMVDRLEGVLRAPLGSVYMAPSRDALRYNDATTQYLFKALTALAYRWADNLITILKQEQALSPIAWRQQLATASQRVRTLLNLRDHERSTPAFSEFVALVLARWTAQTPPNMPTPSYTARTLEHTLTRASYTLPRDIGKHVSTITNLVFYESVCKNGVTFTVKRNAVSPSGTRIDSKGKDLGLIQLPLSGSFEVVYVDCSHAPARIRQLLQANPKLRLLVVTPASSLPKKVAASEMALAANNLMAWSELRGISCSPLSVRVPLTAVPRVQIRSVTEKMSSVPCAFADVSGKLTESSLADFYHKVALLVDDPELEEDDDAEPDAPLPSDLTSSDLDGVTIFLAVHDGSTRRYDRLQAETIHALLKNETRTQADILASELCTRGSSFVVSKLLSVYEAESSRKAYLCTVSTISAAKRMVSLLQQVAGPQIEIKAAFPELFRVYNSSDSAKALAQAYIDSGYPHSRPTRLAVTNWNWSGNLVGTLVRILRVNQAADIDIDYAAPDQVKIPENLRSEKLRRLLNVTRVLLALEKRFDTEVSVYNQAEENTLKWDTLDPAKVQKLKLWSQIHEEVAMQDLLPTLYQVNFAKRETVFSYIEHAMRAITDLTRTEFRLISWTQLVSHQCLLVEAGRSAEIVQNFIDISVEDAVDTDSVIELGQSLAAVDAHYCPESSGDTVLVDESETNSEPSEIIAD